MPSYDQIMHVVKSPEFWMSVAFVCVIILAFRPLRRFLRKWGAKRADDIMSKIETAKEMNQKAEELLQKYETQTRNKEKEKKEILKKSVGEIAFLKKESAAKLHDRIAHKIQSVDFRLKIIEENSRRELKNQMLRILMQKANALLAQDQKLKTAHNIDQSIDKICDALDHRLN